MHTIDITSIKILFQILSKSTSCTTLRVSIAYNKGDKVCAKAVNHIPNGSFFGFGIMHRNAECGIQFNYLYVNRATEVGVDGRGSVEGGDSEIEEIVACNKYWACLFIRNDLSFCERSLGMHPTTVFLSAHCGFIGKHPLSRLECIYPIRSSKRTTGPKVARLWREGDHQKSGYSYSKRYLMVDIEIAS